MSITTAKMDNFVSTVCKTYYRLYDDRMDKALSFVEQLPLTDEHIAALSKSGSEDLAEAAAKKPEQRLQDFEDALGDAVDAGITDLDEFTRWLGLNPEASPESILRQAHVYRRIGEPGRPETAVLN